MTIPRTSIQKKALMAVSGFFLFGFVVVHMLGNLQIYLGREALNAYAQHLKDLPMLLWPARIFLLLTLIVHMLTATQLTLENRRARPTGYFNEDTVQASYASRTMMFSGVIVFLFIVYHILHFTLGVAHPAYFQLTDASGRHDVYSMVILSFQNVTISAVYIIAMTVLCMHLSHGLRSFPQTLGLDVQKYRKPVDIFARGFSLVIFIGNCSIPLCALLGVLSCR